MFLKITEQRMLHARNARLWRAKDTCEPKILFDCSFAALLSHKLASRIAQQVVLAYSENRKHAQPFDLHVCGHAADSALGAELRQRMPQLAHSPLECHSENGTELHAKERLVYLTPASPNVLRELSADDVLVIAGLVEKNKHSHTVLAMCKQAGLRTAWLPTNRFAAWKSNNRGLPFNLLVNILLSYKESGDWELALQQHMPKRRAIGHHMARELVGRQQKLFGVRPPDGDDYHAGAAGMRSRPPQPNSRMPLKHAAD